jgi:hypothetical protein
MEPTWVWTAIGTVLAIETAVVAVVVWLLTQLNASTNSAVTAKAAAESATLALMAEKLERERLAESLNNFKVEVAKEYVSHNTLSNFEKRVVGAVEHLTERFDAFLKGRH